MTGLLKSVMHEHADHATTPRLDLDAMIADGDRRVRRTKVAGAIAGVAAVAVIATAAPFAADQWPDTDSPVAPATQPPFQHREVTYAVGSAIHHGDRVIQVGAGIEVASYVQTDDGFVFATRNGEVFFNDGEQTRSIGHTSRDGLYLKADDDGSYAAWVEFPDGKAPVFVVYDTAEQNRVVETSEGNDPGMGSFRDTDAAYLFGIDADFVYWRSHDGLVRHDITTGQSAILADSTGWFDVADIANGRIAHQTGQVNGASSRLRVSTDLDQPAKPLPSGWNGHLSPGGTYIAVDEADAMAIYDTATQQDVSPDTRGYAFVAAYGWLDDNTVTMIGLETMDESKPIDILSCEISSGACTVAADDAATIGSFALPVGELLD